MAKTNDPRFGTERSSAGNDPVPGRVGWNTLLDKITQGAVKFRQSLSSAMDPAGTPGGGKIQWQTDTARAFWDDGTANVEISPVGGGGVPPGQNYTPTGVAGTEGTSRRAARADHKHPEPAWPCTVLRYPIAAPTGAGPFTTIAMGDRPVAAQAVTMTAGWWRVEYTMPMSTDSSAIDSFSRCTVQMTQNGAVMNGLSLPCDLTRARVPFSHAYQVTGDGQIHTFGLRVNSLATAAQIYYAGWELVFTYLGPGQ